MRRNHRTGVSRLIALSIAACCQSAAPAADTEPPGLVAKTSRLGMQSIAPRSISSARGGRPWPPERPAPSGKVSAAGSSAMRQARCPRTFYPSGSSASARCPRNSACRHRRSSSSLISVIWRKHRGRSSPTAVPSPSDGKPTRRESRWSSRSKSPLGNGLESASLRRPLPHLQPPVIHPPSDRRSSSMGSPSRTRLCARVGGPSRSGRGLTRGAWPEGDT
jgi:hypothetical protein